MKLQKKSKENETRENSILLNVITIIVSFIFIFLFLVVPKVSLKKAYSIINVNGIFDNNLQVKSFFQSIDSNNFKALNSIDNTKIGDYDITYFYEDKFFHYFINEEIKVRDLKTPKIVLTGGDKAYYCPTKGYQELGYEAYDNVDGNITDKVRVIEEKDKIIYEVEDKAGNKARKKRNIIPKDNEKPKITVVGDELLLLPLNSSYQEFGVTAFDSCDGDLTKNVEITNNVVNSKVGTYKVEYKVKDQANNEAVAYRTVKVLEPLKDNTIYLTFDDGPRAGTTSAILDTLKEKNVKATFFVTNNGPDDLIKRIVLEGNSIGIHTATHNYEYIYSSIENYYMDLEIVKDRIYNLTGVSTNLVRFPGGSSNTISKKYKSGIMSELTVKLINDGYLYYDWNIESGDSSFAQNETKLVDHVIASLKHDRPNVILMHDIKSYTANSLAKIIDYGLANGYSFATISENTMPIRQRVNN